MPCSGGAGRQRVGLRRAWCRGEARALWSRLRRKQLLGLQFYRQKPIHQYIVDFYCAGARLVIEVDGGQHWQPDHAEGDRERDAVLAQLGLEVLRFSNREVLGKLDSVVARVHEVASRRLTESTAGTG